jgi:hypothetical protein
VCGGGGSSIGPRPSSARVSDLVRSAVSTDVRTEYGLQVNDLLAGALQEANARDSGSMNQHLLTIRGALEGLLDESVELRYGGSIKKHTYVDGLSDADILAVVSRATAQDSSPKDLIEDFGETLRGRLPRTEVTVGALSVRVRFSDGMEIQVLPAFRATDGFRIARRNGTSWSQVVRPGDFGRELTALNYRYNGNVVRSIKLLKIAQETFPEDSKLAGYHLEALASLSFLDYSGPQTYKDMFLHLMKTASEDVLRPMQESTGQSTYIDNDLGPAGSAERLRVSRKIKRLVTQLENAQETANLDPWEELFSEW